MGWYEALKDAATVADRLRDAELKHTLANIRIECAKLAEDNAALREENLGLREQLKLQQTMAYRDNAYWRTKDGEPEGPFCPKCLDGDRRTSRMTVREDDHCWRCPVCGCAIEKPGDRQRGPVSRYHPGSKWS
jgi:hypothetical protein